jgi:chloride channel protein, CIC family
VNEPAPAPKTPLRHPEIWLVSVLVGLVAGLGAAAFRFLIGGIHNLFFLGKFSFIYNANLHTPANPWGAGIILAPMIGALGVAFLVKTFAPEAKGNGVPEVMEAIYYRQGGIRPLVALIKPLASALSIGSGGSAGREGPIVQIGSAFGSAVGRLLHLPSWQRITMVAAGAGGGIAATFNTPVGGILFAAELLLPEISARTLIPVAIATVTATYIGQVLLGANPSFVLPGFETTRFHSNNILVLLACVVLGGLLGILSAVFIKAIYRCEDFFEQQVSPNYYVRHLLGMSLVGILIYLTQTLFGHYYIEGVSYSTVQDVLAGTLSLGSLLLLLFVLKVVVTALTLGSGGSGGIFSPALFLGATFGGAFGLAFKAVFPQVPIDPPAFAIVGMAGVVGSVTGAALTAIVMIFEMTLDYQMILPIAATVAVSYGVRKALLRNSIYTLKLARRGQPVPETLQSNSWLVRQARDYMDSGLATVSVSAPMESLAQTLSDPAHLRWFLVEDEGELVGVIEAIALASLIKHGGKLSLRATARKDYEVVGEHTAFFELISRTRARQPGLFLVAAQTGAVSARDIKGVISKREISEIMFQAIAPSPE